MTDHKYHSCIRKHSYATEEIAYKQLLWTIRRYKLLKLMQTYECPYCGRWHIGQVQHLEKVA